jgi:hypothetical protein
MGLFGKKNKSSLLPADIVPLMAKYGQARWNLEYDGFKPGPFDEELQKLPPDAQRSWVVALSEAVVPVGGWAAYGAEETVMKALGHPVDLPAYRAILDCALDFQRSVGVWESQLSINEKVYWDKQHGDEPWLIPRKSPARETTPITALPVGQERKVAVMTKVPDSNEVYASHPETSKYVAIVERGADRERVRLEAATAGSLYDLYWKVSQGMTAPNYWVDPELEPFFPFPSPMV